MTTRGRWVYHPYNVVRDSMEPVAAWQLEDTGWWLRRRTGKRRAHIWCRCCLGSPHWSQWWMLYRIPPERWKIATPAAYSRWQGPDGNPRGWYRTSWGPAYGSCTHRCYLAGAMGVAERAYDEHVLRALAGL
jgi:hypothetical protein